MEKEAILSGNPFRTHPHREVIEVSGQHVFTPTRLAPTTGKETLLLGQVGTAAGPLVFVRERRRGREIRRGTERIQVPDVSFIHQTKPKSATSDVAVIDNEFERLGLAPWIAQLTEPPAQTWNPVPL